MPEGGLLFLPPMIPGSQHGGKADLGDLCSGVVSTELGLCPGLPTGGRPQGSWGKRGVGRGGGDSTAMGEQAGLPGAGGKGAPGLSNPRVPGGAPRWAARTGLVGDKL